MKNFFKVITVGLVLLLGLYTIVKYNTMVSKQEEVETAWSQVENVYQRRADLIPNLVSVVKGYASHEKETLKEVIEARAKATSPTVQVGNLQANQLDQFQEVQNGLSGALSKLMVVVERYPELKANENFLALQTQLEGTENRISVERRRFNTVAKSYNTYIRVFPNNIIAKMFSFEKQAYFKAENGAENAPNIEF